MSRSRRSTANSRERDGGSEHFPGMPGQQHPAPSSQQDSNTHSTSTTVTTTTVFNGRDDPVTSTQTQFPTYNDGPSNPTIITTGPGEEAPIPFSQTTVNVPSPIRRRPIGIRRLSSATNRLSAGGSDDGGPSRSGSGRSRSTSDPTARLNVAGGVSQRLTRQSTREPAMATLREEGTLPGQGQQDQTLHVPGKEGQLGRTQTTTGVGRRRSVSNAAHSILSRFSNEDSQNPPHEYDNDVVDYLDVIDPEVSTLTTLTNVQNSLFVPDLGRWINRRPTYTLSRAPSRITEQRTQQAPPQPLPAEAMPETIHEGEPMSQTPAISRTWSWLHRPPVERTHSITSVMTDSHYAVLPHGLNLDDWSEEDKEALDDHVRHMLHSRRSKFKQRMRAFGKYVSKPVGFFVTLYAFCITMFGLAWVLFLIGWIYVGDRQSYLVHIIDSVLVALFALVGDGMAPFRIVDTYHMIWIAKYHYRTWETREKKHMPALQDHNDLPERSEKDGDPEAGNEKEYIVLTAAQQKKLVHHQTKFSKSHSFYKPHETPTHHAFPVKLMITAVVLLDFHSIFQIMLGTFTWSWDYHTRPAWITTVILCFSITVNILAGIIISIGDRRTRKKDVVMRISRQELTQQAIKKVQKHKADRETSMAHAQASENFEAIREEQPENSTFKLQDQSSGSFQSARSH